MEPALYIVATPIGNLEDITLRALSTLREADEVLAEDTRHSRKLFARHDLHTRLSAYHKFNEAARADQLVEAVRSGSSLALISDAGTPAIADPGARLVNRFRSEGLPVIPIPGPSAVAAAVSAAGLDSAIWFFGGFLPVKPGKRKKALERYFFFGTPIILFESPYKLQKLLELLLAMDPDCSIQLFRELTKKFETQESGSPHQILERIQIKPPRGEYTLILTPSGKSIPEAGKAE